MSIFTGHKSKPAQTLESMKLSNKQLETITRFSFDNAVPMTIGQLTLQQLQVLLFITMKENQKMEDAIDRAISRLTEAV